MSVRWAGRGAGRGAATARPLCTVFWGGRRRCCVRVAARVGGAPDGGRSSTCGVVCWGGPALVFGAGRCRFGQRLAGRSLTCDAGGRDGGRMDMVHSRLVYTMLHVTRGERTCCERGCRRKRGVPVVPFCPPCVEGGLGHRVWPDATRIGQWRTAGSAKQFSLGRNLSKSLSSTALYFQQLERPDIVAPQFQPRAINLAAVAGSRRLTPRRHPHHHRPHTLRLGHRGSPASRPATLLHPAHPCLLPTPDPPQCSARRRAAPRRSRGSRQRGGSGGKWPRRWRRTSCTLTFSCLGGPSRRMRRWYVARFLVGLVASAAGAAP